MSEKENIRNLLYNELQEVIGKYTENIIPKAEIKKDIDSVFDSLGYNDVGPEDVEDD